MENIKWWQLLLTGLIIGVIGTVVVSFYFKRPDVNYLLKSQRQGIEIDQLRQKVSSDSEKTAILIEKFKTDTLILNKQLNDLKSKKVEKKFAPLHAHIAAESLDDDLLLSRQSFPQKNPY